MTMTCDNLGCAHNEGKRCRLDEIRIEASGGCQCFRKNLRWYVEHGLKALENKNFIDEVELNLDPSLRVSVYCITMLFGLEMQCLTFGSCEMVALTTGETTKRRDGAPADRDDRNLRASDIRELLPNESEERRLGTLITERDADIHPERFREDEPNRPNGGFTTDAERFAGAFGWLLPDGTFVEAEFGEHGEAAERIIRERGWEDDRDVWAEERHDDNPGDYLRDRRRAVLIHNPGGGPGYVVTEPMRLSRAQTAFLYEYFTALGKPMRAARYLDQE